MTYWIFVVAAIIGAALGVFAYRLSPEGRRKQRKIRELREQLKRLRGLP